jgi:dTDP-4-dehydrorhamnose reductase
MARLKRLFLTGGSGLLALNWALLCHETWDVFLGIHTHKIFPTFAATVQLSQPTTQHLITVLSEISPHLVVNTAAATNIEYCELHPEIAFEVNVVFAEQLACACNHLMIPLVHLSTDHIFDGSFPFATEDSAPHPLNVYGQTKAEAESRVLNDCKDALIIRTNFYGWGTSYRYSMTDKIIQTLTNANVYTAFSDVYFTPILISDLVSSILALVELGANGIFHVVGDQRLSKYDFCLLLAKTFGFKSSLLQPISIDDVPALVQRPKDMSLSNLKATQWLNRSFGSVVEGLSCLRDQSNQGYQKELQQL